MLVPLPIDGNDVVALILQPTRQVRSDESTGASDADAQLFLRPVRLCVLRDLPVVQLHAAVRALVTHLLVSLFTFLTESSSSHYTDSQLPPLPVAPNALLSFGGGLRW